MSIYVFLLSIAVLCFCAGMLFAYAQRPPKQYGKGPLRLEARTGFLFEDDELIDATPVGYRLLAGLDAFNTARANLIALCASQYPDLNNTWTNLGDLETKILKDAATGVCDLEISKVANRVSIRLIDGPDVRGQTIQEDLFASRVQFLSDVVNQSPNLVWKEEANGTLLWSNRKYKEFLVEAGKLTSLQDPSLTSGSLFPDLSPPLEDAEFGNESMQVFENPRKHQEHWFNVRSFPSEGGTLHFATDANDTVSAQNSLKSSLQTFVQIFAQLSIGFGIFDENRQLIIYNPSMVELLNLDPIFLSSKPTLVRVIEELRRTDKAPEPKSFPDFRETIRKLEDAATSGTYESVWTLADGQSLRVTGRPYQTGSLALLIEDVSSELALTRRYRTEIQAHQEILDVVRRPVFLFTPSNVLASQNAAAESFFPMDEVAPANLDQFVEVLNGQCIPGDTIQTSDLLLMTSDTLAPSIHLRDGRTYQFRRHQLSGGLFCIEMIRPKAATSPLPKVIERRNQKRVQ